VPAWYRPHAGEVVTPSRLYDEVIAMGRIALGSADYFNCSSYFGFKKASSHVLDQHILRRRSTSGRQWHFDLWAIQTDGLGGTRDRPKCYYSFGALWVVDQRYNRETAW
jgi:hypothetical protein